MKKNVSRASPWMAVVVALGLFLCCGSAFGDSTQIDSFFDVFFDIQGELQRGNSTGYDGPPPGLGDGSWYYYPNTGWYNAWFYDGNFIEENWKEVILNLQAVAVDPGQPADLCVTINWSTRDWSASGAAGPPLPPMTSVDEARWIGRADPLCFTYLPLSSQDPEGWRWANGNDIPGQGEVLLLEWWYAIWDYNPEWVSVDLRGRNVVINPDPTNPGTIQHTCMPIPEPTSIALLGLGLVGIVVRRLRKQE